MKPTTKATSPVYLTLQGCADYSSYSGRSIRRAIDGGTLPYYKPSTRRLLIRVDDLDRWLSRFRIDPTGPTSAEGRGK